MAIINAKTDMAIKIERDEDELALITGETYRFASPLVTPTCGKELG